jgi:hypothetical protein
MIFFLFNIFWIEIFLMVLCVFSFWKSYSNASIFLIFYIDEFYFLK